MSDETKSTIELPTPGPVPQTVCDLCSEPWAKHLEWQKNRTRSIHDDEPPYELITRKVPPITMMTCVYILQRKNEGPVGHPGVSGPMGAKGDKGDPGRGYDDPFPGEARDFDPDGKEKAYGLPPVGDPYRR